MFTSMSKLDFLDAGSLGIFYPWPGTEAPDDEHKERGWIARSGDWVHIDALEERDPPGVMLNGRFDDDTVSHSTRSSSALLARTQDWASTSCSPSLVGYRETHPITSSPSSTE